MTRGRGVVKIKSLVGFNGLVGSNLLAQARFDFLYNSINVGEAYGTRPDLLVYAGMPGTKYLANHYPEKDGESLKAAMANIKGINPKKLVLISTVDVNSNISGGDEAQEIDRGSLHVYGRNRFDLEEWVKNQVEDWHIVRIPALYGSHLKKNFVFDLMNRTPQRLPPRLYQEIMAENAVLGRHYHKEGDFYVIGDLGPAAKRELEEGFRGSRVNSLLFTDSRAQFQFYNLRNLWKDIETVVEKGIPLVQLVTEPVAAGELYQYIYGNAFVNEIQCAYPTYGLKTMYGVLFGQENGYVASKQWVLGDLKAYVLRGACGEVHHDV